MPPLPHSWVAPKKAILNMVNVSEQLTFLLYLWPFLFSALLTFSVERIIISGFIVCFSATFLQTPLLYVGNMSFKSVFDTIFIEKNNNDKNTFEIFFLQIRILLRSKRPLNCLYCTWMLQKRFSTKTFNHSNNKKENFALAVITLRVYKETTCLNVKVNDKAKIEIETN